MSLGFLEFKDLFDNEITVDLLRYGDSTVTMRLLRKIEKGEYTLLLFTSKNDKNATMMYELYLNVKAKLNFSDLTIQTLEEDILFIAPFWLEDWQREQIYNLIKTDFEPLKIEK